METLSNFEFCREMWRIMHIKGYLSKEEALRGMREKYIIPHYLKNLCFACKETTNSEYKCKTIQKINHDLRYCNFCPIDWLGTKEFKEYACECKGSVYKKWHDAVKTYVKWEDSFFSINPLMGMFLKARVKYWAGKVHETCLTWESYEDRNTP